jgi:hypothetical protein
LRFAPADTKGDFRFDTDVLPFTVRRLDMPDLKIGTRALNLRRRRANMEKMGERVIVAGGCENDMRGDEI